MKKAIVILIILCLVFILYDKFFKKETQILSYSELPEKVKTEFVKITKSNHFIMIGNTNTNCLTNASSAGIPNFIPLIKIKTCISSHYLDFTDTTIRAYVIDGKDIYHIYENKVWSRKESKPNSDFFNLDTLSYKKIYK